MKIISMHVNAFGKIRNADVRLNGGLNVLRQSNGYGKTTLANFIRAMLYGLKRGGKGEYSLSRWIPWNTSDNVGGTMTVEEQGKVYVIERVYGRTSREDVLRFYLKDTASPVQTDLSPGEYLLGLTAESYDRSAYFPQQAVEMSSNDNFGSRLAGVVQNTEDFNSVMDKLRAYKKELRYERGNGGEIYRLQQRQRELYAEAQNRRAAEEKRIQAERRIEQIAEEKRALEGQERQNAAEREALQVKAASLRPTQEQTESQLQLRQLAEKISRHGNFAQDKAECDRLAEEIAATPYTAQPQRRVNVPLLVVAIILAAAGAALCFLSPWTLLGVAAGLACLPFCFKKSGVVTLQAGEKEHLVTQFFTIASKHVQLDDCDFASAEKRLQAAYAEYLSDRKLAEALGRLVVPQGDVAEAERQLAENAEKGKMLAEKLRELAREEGYLRSAASDVLPVAEVYDSLKNVSEQLAQAERRYEIAQTVADLLTKAQDNLSISYLPVLRERCAQLLCGVLEKDYKVVADRNFGISLTAEGVTRPIEEFSRGTQELVMLCFRIALSELLFKGEAPLLILDDALVNLDEKNFDGATKIISRMGNTQVLYLTCHDRKGSLA